MKSIFYALFLSLFSLTAFAQMNNRGSQSNQSGQENLTDAQRRESQNYMHTGRSQRLALEGCAEQAGVGLTEAESKLFQENPSKAYEQFGGKLDKANELCGGQADVKGMGLSPLMAGAISKAYTMIIGMGPLGEMKYRSLDDIAAEKQAKADELKTDDKAVSEEAQKAQKEADEAAQDAQGEDERDKTDYCKYVAMGTEMIAMVQQTMAQEEINSVPLPEERNAQRASLMRVARGYEEREKNAQTQFMGWGTTTACYTIMMVANSSNMVTTLKDGGWQNYLKIGAAGFMTKVYYDQKEGFADAASKTKKVANALPGAGDCNKYTDKDCYCSEPTTKHDPHCSPYLHKRSIRDPGVTMRTSCITNRAEADPQCKCMADDTCLHKGIDTLFSLDGLQGQINPVMMSDLQNLSTGTVAGSMNTAAVNRNLNAARTAMRKADEELSKLTPPRSTLTAGEKLEAEFLESQGVPKTLAMAMASAPVNEKEMKATLAAMQSRLSPTNTAKKESSFNTSIKDNRSAGGLRPKKKVDQKEASNPFAKFMNQGKKGSAASSGNVLHLAQQAEASAQISNRKESSVFDIISRRYQVSAWRRLDLDQDL